MEPKRSVLSKFLVPTEFSNVIRTRIKDALRQMRSFDQDGNPAKFDLLVCTHDKKRKTGGKKIELKRVSLYKLTKGQAERRPGHRSGNSIITNPFHDKNNTVNLLLQNGQIRKINIWLILEFNEKPVHL